jgi:hypothetical protein
LTPWVAEPLWRGKRVFLIGGGPSLKGFRFELLANEECLAINEAFLDVPWASVLFFRDFDWFAGRAEILTEWPGRIITVSPGAAREWPGRVLFVESNTREMPRARTSGQQAVALAVMMAARQIVLLGYDWNPDGGNYHNRYPKQGLEYRGGLVEGWKGYRERASRAGCEIVNATPESAIRNFRRCEIAELL